MVPSCLVYFRVPFNLPRLFPRGRPTPSRQDVVNIFKRGIPEQSAPYLCSLFYHREFSLAVAFLLSSQNASTMSSPPPQAGVSPSNFKSMLDAALAEFKKKTGNDLLSHWLAAELQTCESVDAVLDILRDQAKVFEPSGKQKLMKWIDPLVNHQQKP